MEFCHPAFSRAETKATCPCISFLFSLTQNLLCDSQQFMPRSAREMKLQIFPQVGLELEKLHIELFEGQGIYRNFNVEELGHCFPENFATRILFSVQ